ncbi:UDP-N-acetylglucosamine transferase subunit ALG14 [Periplaneta americana]|uniref:UDP-N-acetylglucosamine transferase subunit ALG14 n=1 Tax=Periplaneta americana TaxID=6978 RepID=UPI0037E9B51C
MICFLLFVLLFSFGARLLYVLYCMRYSDREVVPRRYQSLKTAIIIGSGGHTAEMIRLLQGLNSVHFSPRLYIVASNDTSSEVKIYTLEETCFTMSEKGVSYKVFKIPRSRNVGQSYITSVLTTCISLFATIPIMGFGRPELIICNGPGTCVPVCIVAFIMRIFCITDTKIVYVESICRVRTLSLSGRILLLFADDVFVQWPMLQERYRRTKYIGRLT